MFFSVLRTFEPKTAGDGEERLLLWLWIWPALGHDDSKVKETDLLLFWSSFSTLFQ